MVDTISVLEYKSIDILRGVANVNTTIRTSQARIDKSAFWSLLPKTRAAVLALGATANDADLEPELLELVHLRCSQINGCAWCVQYHIGHLQKLGMAPAKNNLVAAWPQSGIL